MITARGEQGLLPVTTSRHVTWDKVTWRVLDKSMLQLFEQSCQTPCLEQVFSFNVDTAGFHSYVIVVDKEGARLVCMNQLIIFGMYTLL